MSDEIVDRMVRRRAGMAALRRLRRWVDAEQAQDAANARWAKRFAWGLAVALALAAAWIAAHF